MFGFVLFVIFSSIPIGDLPAFDTDPLALSDEAKSFFDERVERGYPELRRLEILVDVMFKKDGLGFRYDTRTRNAEDTFRHASGDCLSFTNLFIAVARHLDLDVRFREVEIAPNWSKRGKVVVFNRHVNSVAVIGGSSYLIDLFPRVDRIEVGGRIVSDARGLAHYYNNLGAEWFGRGSPKLALHCFERALESDSDAPFVWANYAVALSHLGLVDEAEDSYRKAISLDKSNMVAIGNLADLYEKMGNLKEAQKLKKKADDFRRKNPYFHYSQGEEAYKIGLYQAALKHYRDALKRKSKEHHFHYALARTYVKLGDNDKALEHLEKARKYAPDDSGRLRYSHKLDLLATTLDNLHP
ncbi:MAG: tetratricopeptide repeat protein [Acidobacteriota bacterium]|nr:MAG: tetratricopeptide repeat protein [Acidobacteriota bacterium]